MLSVFQIYFGKTFNWKCCPFSSFDPRTFGAAPIPTLGLSKQSQTPIGSANIVAVVPTNTTSARRAVQIGPDARAGEVQDVQVHSQAPSLSPPPSQAPSSESMVDYPLQMTR